MELTQRFFSTAIVEATAEDSPVELRRMRTATILMEALMLAAPEFINALGRLPNDIPTTRLKGFITMLWLHCMGMRDTLAIAREGGGQMWNVCSLAVQARAAQECFVGLFYFCIEAVDKDEGYMRELLWCRHVTYKRAHLASELAGVAIPARIEASLKADQALMVDIAHRLKTSRRLQLMEKTEKGRAKKILNSPDAIFAEDQGAIWSRAEGGDTVFRRAWVYLSQAVHSTPFAVSRITMFQADIENAADVVHLPLILAVGCFSGGVRHAAAVEPSLLAQAGPILDLANQFRRELEA